MWLAQVGVGDVLLALVPTFNLIALAFVWKKTGKIGPELTGEIHTARGQIQDDLENGIRHAVESNTQHIQDLQSDVSAIHGEVSDIHDHMEAEGMK